MLARTQDLLLEAQRQQKAIAAINAFNMETVQAAVHAAELSKRPVIIALGERYLPSTRIEGFAAMVRAIAEAAAVPVSLHLDHAYEKSSIEQAIRYGFSSVMYDGSRYELEQNIAQTRAIVELAHAFDVAVEAEIGSVARGAHSDEEEGDGRLTSPADAQRFVTETGVDSLAAAIGTVHGMYTGTPNINLALLASLRDSLQVPLVLHGGSGTPEAIIAQAVLSGICKVNVNTEVSLAAVDRLRRYAESGSPQLHLSVMTSGLEEAMIPVISKFIQLLGSPADALVVNP